MKSSLEIDPSDLICAIRKQNETSNITFVASASESVSEQFNLYSKDSRIKNLDDFESIGFSHENKLLRSPFRLGNQFTRPCLRNADCIGMKKIIHGHKEIDDNGIIFTEYMSPREYDILKKHGHYPKKRRLCVLCTRDMVQQCFSMLSQKPISERNVLLNSYSNVCGANDGYQEKYCIVKNHSLSEKNLSQDKTWNGIIGNVCANHYNIYKFIKDKRNDEEKEDWYLDQSLMEFKEGKKQITRPIKDDLVLTKHVLSTQGDLVSDITITSNNIFNKETVKMMKLCEEGNFKINISRLILISKVNNELLDLYVYSSTERYALNIIKHISEKLSLKVSWINKYEDIAWYEFKTRCFNSISNISSKLKPISIKIKPLESLIDNVFKKFFDVSINEKMIHRNFVRICEVYMDTTFMFKDLLKIFFIANLCCNKKRPSPWRYILNATIMMEDNDKLKSLYETIIKSENLTVYFLERVVLNLFVSRLECVPKGLEKQICRTIEDQKLYSRYIKKSIESCNSQEDIMNMFSDFISIERKEVVPGKKRRNSFGDLQGLSKKLKLVCSKQVKRESCDKKSSGTFSVSPEIISSEGNLNCWSIEGAMKILKSKDMHKSIYKLDMNSSNLMGYYFGRSVYFYGCLNISLPYSIVKLQTEAVKNRFKCIPEPFQQTCIKNACKICICPNCFHVKNFVLNSHETSMERHGSNPVKINGFDIEDVRCVQREECGNYKLENFNLLHPNEAGFIWCNNGFSFMISPCCGKIMQSSLIRSTNNESSPFTCVFCIQNSLMKFSQPTMSCAYCMREFKRKNSSVYTSCILKDEDGQKKTFLFCTRKHFKKTFWTNSDWTIGKAINYIKSKNSIYR